MTTQELLKKIDKYLGIKNATGTEKPFFSGADNADGLNANFYVQADGNVYFLKTD